MDANGWIKLHRKLLDWPMARKPTLLALWVYCLLRANHAPCDVVAGGKTLHLEPGQFITGRVKASRDTGLTPKQVRTGYVSLMRHGCIKSVSTKGQPYSVVTVVNWKAYQADTENKGQPKGQARAKLGPTKGQARATDKNDKNDKNDKKETHGALVASDDEPFDPPIDWQYGVGFSNITDTDRTEWQAAYPACDLDRQLAAMTAWLKANPAKAHKSNWRRFVVSWLTRSQDKGGDITSNHGGSAPAPEGDLAARYDRLAAKAKEEMER